MNGSYLVKDRGAFQFTWECQPEEACINKGCREGYLILCVVIACSKFKKSSRRPTFLHQLVISMTILLYTMCPNFINLFFQLLCCKSYPPEKKRRLQGSLDLNYCFEASRTANSSFSPSKCMAPSEMKSLHSFRKLLQGRDCLSSPQRSSSMLPSATRRCARPTL